MHAELALRYWHKTGTFFRYVVIALQSFSTAMDVRIHENVAIALIQPSLNHPHISKILTTATDGFNRKQYLQQKHATPKGKRTWKRLRHLEFKHNDRTVCSALTQRTNQYLPSWKLLTELATATLKAFKACQLLRNSNYPEIRIYALYRQAKNMEEPYQSKALHKLKKIMQYRNMTIPRQAIPLKLPFLAHRAFKQHVQQWIKRQRMSYLNLTIPLHLPNKSVVEVSHPTLGQKLYNWKQAMRSWTSNSRPACTCTTFLQDHPEAPRTTEGHLAAAAYEIHTLPSTIKEIMTSSAQDSYYSAKQLYIQESVRTVAKWAEHHHLPQHAVS